ncbi:MAG: Gfo/Idh/MocA family oxidoreductase [Thermoguttaceae bacterium]|jgi:predicted dehydrogenase|nr:Gfo/Idh/MocA family oxidoreductase [Thermoguttaceae bacterium]
MHSHQKGRAKVSRRDFVFGTAAAGAAMTGLSLARSAHAAGSDVIRVGLVGCGGRGTGAAAQAMEADPGVRLVAMGDVFASRVESRRKALASQRPDQMAVDDDHCFVGLDAYRKVIEASDVVLIANAAKFHPVQMAAAIEAGKHVFVEKPHAIDPAGIHLAAKACEVAKEKKLGVLSGLHCRFQANIRETVRRIHDGQIGEIVAIEENFLRGPYGNTVRPEGMTELEIQYGNQYRFSWLCGDDVTQSLVHNLDRATWALGETPPARCHGLGGRSGAQNLLGDVFDHHSVVYHYANGVRLYAHCRTALNCYGEYSSIILGSKGIAYPMAGRITGENPWQFEGPVPNPHQAEQTEYFASLRAGEPLHCGDYMTRSTLAAVMGQLSCYSGKQITWDEANGSDYFLPPAVADCTWDMTPPTQPDENGVYPVCAVPGFTGNV